MSKAITQPKSSIAEQLIKKDLMNAFIAEQFFSIDDDTTQRLSSAPEEVKSLYPGLETPVIYIGDVCFLVEKGYRQGYQWVAGSSVYYRGEIGWMEISSPLEISQTVLQLTLSEKAYAHPGVADFQEELRMSIEQLSLSLEHATEYQSMKPVTPYDWHLKGEMIASLRDRPFHPLAKAKVGFNKEDYQHYMAEFGHSSTLHWVAVHNDSIIKGNANNNMDCLDLLNNVQRSIIENEIWSKKISKKTYTIMPVHAWQLKKILLPNFKNEIADQTIILLDSQTGDFLATSSVRSLASPNETTSMLKLPISVKSLGAARYLPVVKLLNGIAGEKMLRQAVASDETLADKVFLCEENNWWGYMPESMGLFDDHPRHLAAQVRIYPEEVMKEGYKVIPMSSLSVGMGEGDHFLSELMGGDLSENDIVTFYTDLTSVFYDVTMKLFKVGVVPEVHGQNCCLVLKDNKIIGLLFRDHDSVRLHQPYLDKHHIKDPLYHIRPGYSNSLYNETIEKLVYYIQSLGTQVNLAAIIESLAEAYSIPEKEFWKITKRKLREALHAIDIPVEDRKKLHKALFECKEWPVKLIIRPLLESDGVPGAMPSGKGVGHNPFYQE